MAAAAEAARCTHVRVASSTESLVLARARRGEADVVLACLPSDGDPEDDARFKERLRALDRACGGPGAIALLDVGAASAARTRWLVRPFVAGPTLSFERPRSLLDALSLLDPVARALGRAHRAGLVHGALSPEAIAVTEHGAVLLDLPRAAARALLVDPAHAAPELLEARAEVPAPPVDVFALALLFVEVASGAAAWGGVATHELYARVVDRAVRPVLSRRGVPVAKSIDRVLERALAVDPEARFPDADAFWDALRAAVLASPEPIVEPPRPKPADLDEEPSPRGRARPRPPPVVVAAATAALVVVAFGVEAGVGAVLRARERSLAAGAASIAPSSSPSVDPRVAAASVAPSTAPSTSASATAPEVAAPKEMVAIPADAPTFYVDRTEVTVAAYRACVDAGACKATWKYVTGYDEADPLRRERACNLHRKGREDHPVNCVSFEHASAFCAWAGKRLPSGDEWTRAARGDVGDRRYPWGDSFPRCADVVFARYGPDAWGCKKQPPGTAPADSHPKSASPFGALDMAGSLWEWTTERSARGFPILRGGAWDSPETSITIESRLEQAPKNGDVTLGFRCVKDAP